MNTYLNPDAIKNFTIPADKLSNTIVFKFVQTLAENQNLFMPDENYKEHNWEVIQKFNESYIYGNGSSDIYYITLLFPKDDGYIITHERYTGQIRITGDEFICGLIFNDGLYQQDTIKYKYIWGDVEVWVQETNNDELFESFSNSLGIRVIDLEVPTNTYLNSCLEAKQDVISDIEEIRTNAANYKGTVTSVSVDGYLKSPSSTGQVSLGFVNKQLVQISNPSITLSPNIYFRNTNTSLSNLTINLGSGGLNNTIINEYFIEFTTSPNGTTVSLPATIKWMNGVIPTFEPSTTYQISIVNNLGTWVKFK